MTAEEKRKALELLTSQAKEAVIVKVLERIATSLEAIQVALRTPQPAVIRWPSSGPDSTGAYPGEV